MKRDCDDIMWMYRQVDASQESLVVAMKACDVVHVSGTLNNEEMVRLCEVAVVRAKNVYDENLIGFSSKQDALLPSQ